MKRLSKIVRQPIFYQGAIVVYVICVVGLLSAYMSVSTLSVTRSAYFQTFPVLESGRPNAMRGLFMNAETGETMTRAKIQVELVEPQPGGGEEVPDEDRKSVTIGHGQSGAGGLVHLQMAPPADWEAGSYDLVVRAQNAGEKELVASSPVTLSHRNPGMSGEFEWRPSTSRAENIRGMVRGKVAENAAENHVHVDVTPPDGELVRGLPNTIFIRTSDPKTGAPVPSIVRFGERQGVMDGGLPRELRTDRLGLARMELTPVTNQVWKVQAEPIAAPIAEPIAAKALAPGTAEVAQAGVSEATLRLFTVPAQFSLRMRDRIAVPGNDVNGQVRSLYRSGGFMVDLFENRAWLESTTFGLAPNGSGLKLEIPRTSAAPDIYRIQVYQSFYGPGRAWDVAYVLRADDGTSQARQEAVTRLVATLAKHADVARPYFQHLIDEDRLASATDAEIELWLEAFLMSLPRHFEEPPVVVNTQKGDRDELEVWKKDMQRELMIFTILIFIIGMAVVLYFVLVGIRRANDHARILHEVDLEFADPDASSDDGIAAYMERTRATKLEQLTVAVQGFIVLTTLFLFGLGILLLLSYL